ncbi:hypothetical protein BH20ACT19_BH20ACT19_10120 [soil metagenome]
MRLIADILARFDVVAIQEARGNLKALRHTLKALGPEWGLLLTDVNRGAKGNDERLAFVFDTRRVKPSGLAAELVIPPEQLGRISENALREQFVRTPYAVSFQAAGQDVHPRHAARDLRQEGRGPDRRAVVDRRVAGWPAGRAASRTTTRT